MYLIPGLEQRVCLVFLMKSFCTPIKHLIWPPEIFPKSHFVTSIIKDGIIYKPTSWNKNVSQILSEQLITAVFVLRQIYFSKITFK